MKKRTKIILGTLFIILLTLNLTIPSEDDYYGWLDDEYNIQESEGVYYYSQNDLELFDLSTRIKEFGIFRARQQNFEYVDDENELGESFSGMAFRELDSNDGMSIRTLEIGKMIFPMTKDNILWNILMW